MTQDADTRDMACRVDRRRRGWSAATRCLVALVGVVGALGWSGLAPLAGAVGDCTPSAGWGTLQPSLESQVVQLVNAHRTAMGLGALTLAPSLTASAEWKSLHMAAYNYLAHDDPGPPVSRTVSDRLAACGYPTNAAGWGENIAYGYPDASSVMAGWLSDAPHKANLENPAWTTIGVGVAQNGSGTLYWTQDFGTTGASSSPPSSPPPSTSGDTTAPSVPTGLAAGAASGTTVNFSWQRSSDDTGVAGYDVILNGTVLGTTASTAGTIGGLACGTSYTLSVDAFDPAGNHSSTASIVATTTGCAGLPPPPPVSQQLVAPIPVPGASAPAPAPAAPAAGAVSPPSSSGSPATPGATGTKTGASMPMGSPEAIVPRVLARTRTTVQLRWHATSPGGAPHFGVLVDGVERTVVGQAGVMLRRLSCGRPHRVVIVPLGAGGGARLTLRVAARACARP